MRSAITFQHLPVLIDGHDTEGRLVLHEGQLVAVLARLDGHAHDQEFKGRWHLEAGLGPCQAVGTYLFDTLEAAADWADRRVRSQCKPSLARRAAVSDDGPRT
jgi:hypothetical protein